MVFFKYYLKIANITFLSHSACLFVPYKRKKKERNTHKFHGTFPPTIKTLAVPVRFLVLKVASMKMRALWDIALCSLGVGRRFRGVYCLHHQGDDGGSTHL
jgi:hypothetical protein